MSDCNNYFVMVRIDSPSPVIQDNKVVGRQADVMQAAYLAGEIAHRMVVPGGEVSEYNSVCCQCCVQ